MNDFQTIPPEIMGLLSHNGETQREATFFSELVKLADRIGMTDAQVYNAIGMNRSLWYRMRDNKDARTKKENILKLVIVLQLSFWEAFYLIALAGYSFVPGVNKTDEVVAYCLFHKIFTPESVDEMLYEKGCETLFNEA